MCGKKFDTVITNKSDQAALMFYHIFNNNKLSSMTDEFNKKKTLKDINIIQYIDNQNHDRNVAYEFFPQTFLIKLKAIITMS